MNSHSEISEWISNDMQPGIWYNCDRDKAYKMIKALPKDVELTFKSDYSKVKKTNWINGRPQ